MNQAIMTAPGKIEFRDVDYPELESGQVMMETRRIGICGSDIHVFHGMHPYTDYPIVQGHEVSGIISAVGEGVLGFSVGDKITFAPQVVCGDCYPCKHGMYHICENLKVMGFQTNGTAQEFFPLPAEVVFKLPESMSLDHAAMIEPIAVAVHAVLKGGDVNGKKVLVLGAGTIGNLVAQVAKSFGAQGVMITDINDYKVKKAQSCGIDFCINTTETDLDQAILGHFGPDRADLILECVGAQETISQAVEYARKGTKIVVVGVFGEKPVVDLGLVQDRELQLIGTLMYRNSDYDIAIDLVSSGKMQLEDLITHRFKFNQYLEAYQAIEASNGEYMKVMIEMD